MGGGQALSPVSGGRRAGACRRHRRGDGPDHARASGCDPAALRRGPNHPGRDRHRCGARFLHQTDDYWMDWLRATTYEGRFDEPLHRSALALKLMQYQPTGAFVAAPTTSLPESPGGPLNWDYRYSWIRDTSDLVNALYQMGFVAEGDG